MATRQTLFKMRIGVQEVLAEVHQKPPAPASPSNLLSILLPSHRDLPPLVRLATLVRGKVVVALKPFCAFLAIEFTQSRQILFSLGVLVELEVAVGAQVGVDLVDIARVATRLLLGVCSPNGGHGVVEDSVGSVRMCGWAQFCDGVLVLALLQGGQVT